MQSIRIGVVEILKIEPNRFQIKKIPKVSENGSIGVNGRDPQKSNLGPLPNAHTQFQLPSSNLEGSYARKNSEKEKKMTKNYFFGAVKG